MHIQTIGVTALRGLQNPQSVRGGKPDDVFFATRQVTRHYIAYHGASPDIQGEMLPGAPSDYPGSAVLQSAFLREMLLVRQVPTSPHTTPPIGRYMTATFLHMVHFNGLIWGLQTVSCAPCRSSVSMEVLLSRHVATSCCSRKMKQIQMRNSL